MNSEREVRRGFLFLSFENHSCWSHKPFWPIEGNQ